MCNRTDCYGSAFGELACSVCRERDMSEGKEWPGCSSGGCIFGDPGGMHTNGPCNCLELLDTKKRRNVAMLISRMQHENRKQQRMIDWLAQAAANNGWQGLRVSAEDMIAKAKEAAQ